MGNEIAQFREWGQWREQDYDVLMHFPMHEMFARFSKDVGLTYMSHRALNEGEYNSACFKYIINDRRDDLVYAYERCAGGEKVLAIFNFSDRDYHDYEIRVSGNHQLNELINTDAAIYGGNNSANMISTPVRNNRCYVNLAAYSGRLFVVE
jgi:1,4-alpha-glucan branching enzyme